MKIGFKILGYILLIMIACVMIVPFVHDTNIIKNHIFGI